VPEARSTRWLFLRAFDVLFWFVTPLYALIGLATSSAFGDSSTDECGQLSGSLFLGWAFFSLMASAALPLDITRIWKRGRALMVAAASTRVVLFSIGLVPPLVAMLVA
jgi:hypothetical protein